MVRIQADSFLFSGAIEEHEGKSMATQAFNQKLQTFLEFLKFT